MKKAQDHRKSCAGWCRMHLYIEEGDNVFLKVTLEARNKGIVQDKEVYYGIYWFVSHHK